MLHKTKWALLLGMIPGLAGAQTYKQPEWWNDLSVRSQQNVAPSQTREQKRPIEPTWAGGGQWGTIGSGANTSGTGQYSTGSSNYGGNTTSGSSGYTATSSGTNSNWQSTGGSNTGSGTGSTSSDSSGSTTTGTNLPPPPPPKPVFVSACAGVPKPNREAPPAPRYAVSLDNKSGGQGETTPALPPPPPPPPLYEKVRERLEGAKWTTLCTPSRSASGETVYEKRTLSFSCEDTASLTIDTFADPNCSARFESVRAKYRYKLTDFNPASSQEAAIDFSPINGSPSLINSAWSDIVSVRDVESTGLMQLGKFAGGARPSQWASHSWKRREEAKVVDGVKIEEASPSNILADPVNCDAKVLTSSPSGLSGPAFQASFKPRVRMNQETGKIEYAPAGSVCSTLALNPFMPPGAACNATNSARSSVGRASLAPVNSKTSKSHLVFDPRPVNITDPAQMKAFSRFVGDASNSYVECHETAEVPGTFLCLFGHTSVANLMFFRSANYAERNYRQYPRGYVIPGYMEWSDLNSKGYVNGFDLEKKDLLAFYKQSLAECEAGNREKCPNDYERNMFENFILPLSQVRDNFVILGVGYGKVGTLSHEIVHAQYFLRPDYRAAVDCFWEAHVKPEARASIKNSLEDSYDTSYRFLMINEFQAYVLQNDTPGQLKEEHEKYKGLILQVLGEAGIPLVQPATFN